MSIRTIYLKQLNDTVLSVDFSIDAADEFIYRSSQLRIANRIFYL